MHKEQTDSTWEFTYDNGFTGKEIVCKCPGCKQEIHGIDTRHTIFKVLFEPVACETETIKISESDKEARKDKEDSYPDMKFVKKSLKSTWHSAIENVRIMRDKYKVGSQCTYAC